MKHILLCICRITAEELSRSVYIYLRVYRYIKIGKYYSAWVMESRAEFCLEMQRGICVSLLSCRSLTYNPGQPACAAGWTREFSETSSNRSHSVIL